MAAPKITVFGAGLIGRRHVEQATAQARLAAIVDPTDAARTLAAEAGVPHFADPESYLAAERPDGIVIATPNHLHAAHALAAIAAGVPVLIEKPLADTRDNADRIVQAARAADVPVLVGHHRRHNPIVARAKAEIAAGTLGQIVAVQGQFWLYKPADYFEATWRKGPGAGPAMINFIHDVDLLRHFCGEIVEVQAMRSNVRRGQSVEDTAAVLLRFENGALGTFSLSDTIAAPWSWEMTSGENPIYPHHPGTCYTIGGTQAALSVPDLRLWSHDGPRSWWNPINAQTLQVDHADAFVRQFSHFIDVINGAPPLVSAEEGRASLAAVLDVLQATLPAQETP
ncbi:Gfo/Idh/MocA family protein [Yoonia sp. R2331]|uniref:Gfo/Idh/MocA family protein n=1 Tax=Yoonia sp. R2331 TaxID=3237238 RepID=UPI0034E4FF26